MNPRHFIPRKAINALAYSLSFIMLGIFSAAEGPALPSLAENTAASLDKISLLFVFASLGYLVGSFLGGRAYDRFPGHRLMSLMLLLMSVVALVIPFTHQLWLILLAFFVIGIGKGAVDVGGNTLLLWEHGKDAAPYVNSLHFSFGLGATLGPLAVALLILLNASPLNVFILFSLLFLPVAVWLWFLPEPAPLSAEEEERQTAPSAFVLVLVVLAFAFYVGAEVGFGNWVYTYALTLGLGTASSAAYLTSGYWGIFTLGRLVGIWLAAHLPPKRLLFIDLIGSLLSVLLIILFPASPLALWSGTVLLGLFMASIFPSIIMLAGERMQITGTVTGWFLVGAGIGGMSIPWLIGQAFVQIGPRSMPFFIFVALFINLLAILAFLLRPERKLISDAQTV